MPHGFLFIPEDKRLRRKILFFGAVLAVLFALLAVLLSLWQAIGLALALGFIFITVLRPRWTLFFLLVWLPFEPFILKFVPEALFLYARFFSEVLIYIFAASIAARIFIGEKRIKASPLDLPVLLFLLTAIASAVINFVPFEIAALGIRQLLRFVLVFFAVFALYPPREFIRKAVLAMFVIVLFQSLLGLAQIIGGGALDALLLPSEARFFEGVQINPGAVQYWDPGSRTFGTLGRFDQLGVFLAFFMLIVIGFLYEKELWKDRRELWILLALGAGALFFSYSRSAWFGFLLGLLLVGIVLARDKRVMLGAGAVLIMILGYLAWNGALVPRLIETPGARQTAAERFFEAFSYERWRSEYFGLGRLYFIAETPRRVISKWPVFGAGPGRYGGGAAAALGITSAYDEAGIPFGVEGFRGIIDNNWFSIWGELGTLGLILYVWLYLSLFFAAVKVWRYSTDPLARGLALGFCGAMLAVALNAFLATMLESRTLAFYLWSFGAFVLVLGRREKIV